MGVFWPCYSHDPRTGAPTPDRSRARRGCSSRELQPDRARGRDRSTSRTARRGSTSASTGPPSTTHREDYPLFLTTGRVVSQFLSGTQTRRIGPLVKQYPEPRIELHPRLAEKLGIADGDWTTCETRRGDDHAARLVVTTIRPDTSSSRTTGPATRVANRLTVAAQDPISKIPQYKVCGCRVRQAPTAPPAYAANLEPQQ